nr:coiled-coil domain-containing protein 96-like [Aegilops tauschii subsp. strangulata]
MYSAQCASSPFFPLYFPIALASTLDAATPSARNLLRWERTRRRPWSARRRRDGGGEGQDDELGGGGSSSRFGLPPGWIQGDWIRSMIRKEDLVDLVEGGLIAHESWRLPGNETEPQPQEGVSQSTGIDDTTRIYAEEVTEETMGQWLQGITGNKDNPRGSRRVLPLDSSNEPDKIYTEMYSMPNGEQYHEGEASSGDSANWKSDDEDEEENEDSSSGEEADSPPRSERRSKQAHDPASVRGKAVVPSTQTSKRARTSSPVPTEKAPKQLNAATSGTSIYKDDDDEEIEDAATSKAEDQMKVVREASQATYDASSALQANVQKSFDFGVQFTDLQKKQIQLNLDLELAKENMQKAKDEATAMGEDRALGEANKEVVQLKKDKVALTDEVGDLTWKRDELEVYLGGLAKKLFLMLEEFCQNFEEETGRIETNLDPINSPVMGEAAMNMLRLESCLASAMDYLEWKKSSARCGADVALSLVRVHCKEAKEEKLAALKVANTKKLDFQSFMETFIEAATRIADGIDLDGFVEPASPPPAE